MYLNKYTKMYAKIPVLLWLSIIEYQAQWKLSKSGRAKRELLKYEAEAVFQLILHHNFTSSNQKLLVAFAPSAHLASPFLKIVAARASGRSAQSA